MTVVREAGFTEAAVRRLNRVLSSHGIVDSAFEEDSKDPKLLRRKIRHAGEDLIIAVYDGILVMESADGRSRYELVLRKEFASGQAMIEGFATRLDRFLGGGPWELPDEVDSLVDKLIRWVRRLFR